MKKLRNRRLAHPDGRIEWIMTRAARVGGVLQELGLVRVHWPTQSAVGRQARAVDLLEARAELRAYLARVSDSDNKSVSPHD